MKLRVLGACLACSAAAFGGVFTRSSDPGVDVASLVNHAYGYTGVAGELTVRICVGPTAEPFVGEISNAVAKWNALQVEIPNCGGRCIVWGESQPVGPYVREAVLLHELGHCVFGFDHQTESGTNFTNTYLEASITPGADGYPGTNDDIVLPLPGGRLIHWFYSTANNPFDTTPVDPSFPSYTRRIDLLPAGHRWAANGNRVVGERLGVAWSQSIMYDRGSPLANPTGFLSDDVHMAQFPAYGLDEIAGSDDYSVTLELVADCIADDAHVIVVSTALPEEVLGRCTVSDYAALPIPGQPVTRHFALSSASGRSVVALNTTGPWPEELSFWSGFETGDTSEWSSTTP